MKVCPDCNKQIKDISTRCKSCSKKGDLNPMRGKHTKAWKGGKARHSCGYNLIYIPGHPNANSRGYVFEHRLVMENFLERALVEGEVIHHINGVKTDNRIENLELTTQSDHLSKCEFKRYEDADNIECSKCKEIKSKSEFSIDRRSKRGLQSSCKECMKNTRKVGD